MTTETADYLFGDRGEAATEDVMIILAERVIGKKRMAARLTVIEGTANYSLRSLEQQPRVGTNVVVAVKIGHFGMTTP